MCCPRHVILPSMPALQRKNMVLDATLRSHSSRSRLSDRHCGSASASSQHSSARKWRGSTLSPAARWQHASRKTSPKSKRAWATRSSRITCCIVRSCLVTHDAGRVVSPVHGHVYWRICGRLFIQLEADTGRSLCCTTHWYIPIQYTVLCFCADDMAGIGGWLMSKMIGDANSGEQGQTFSAIRYKMLTWCMKGSMLLLARRQMKQSA